MIIIIFDNHGCGSGVKRGTDLTGPHAEVKGIGQYLLHPPIVLTSVSLRSLFPSQVARGLNGWQDDFLGDGVSLPLSHVSGSLNLIYCGCCSRLVCTLVEL